MCIDPRRLAADGFGGAATAAVSSALDLDAAYPSPLITENICMSALPRHFLASWYPSIGMANASSSSSDETTKVSALRQPHTGALEQRSPVCENEIAKSEETLAGYASEIAAMPAPAVPVLREPVEPVLVQRVFGDTASRGAARRARLAKRIGA